jgi:hypothetical protein
MDNWYRESYSTEPDDQVRSLNVTVIALLPMVPFDSSDTRAALRSAQFPEWPGHVQLGLLVTRVDSVAAEVCRMMAGLQQVARQMLRSWPTRDQVRVPLDVVRPAVRSLPWHPWMLSEFTVSSNHELLRVLESAQALQSRSRLVMPLLVDENIHYRLLRLLYGRGFVQYDVHQHLARMPLLFGIWHPYKHTLTVLYRAFFPLLALLELTEDAPTTGDLVLTRKVLFMEKMFGALLLCVPSILPRLQSKLDTLVAQSRSVRGWYAGQ